MVHKQYLPDFLSRNEADTLLRACDRMKFFRKPNPRNPSQFLKRGTITFQDSGLGLGAAVLGNNHNTIRPITTAPQAIVDLRGRLTVFADRIVNYLSLNRYPDGTSGIGFHNHREDFGVDTPVLLVSVGAARTFYLREIEHPEKLTGVRLEHGSLFVMPSRYNRTHHHGILPEPEVSDARYSFNCKCLGVL